MHPTAKKVSNLASSNTVAANDYVMIVAFPDSEVPTKASVVVRLKNAFPSLFGNTANEVKKANVTFTANQVFSLNTTPVSIVAAQGANKIIVPQVLVLHFAGNVAYVNTTASQALQLSIGTTVITLTNDLSGFALSSNANYFHSSHLDMDMSSAAVANSTNKPLVVSSGSNFSVGNGVLKISVQYSVESIG